uniref:DUF3615 domain-containing protein n=1 Tax=Oryza rufipogon TaxID=4529 RepID=A0A0E0MVL6_ORYRU
MAMSAASTAARRSSPPRLAVSGFNSCSWSHGTNIPSTAALYLGGEWGRLSTDRSRFRPPANVPVRANSDHDRRSTTVMWPSPRRWLLAHTTAKLPATHSASVSAARRPPLPSVPPAPALAWPPPCREISDCIARPHVRIALNYYNFNHPGAEFDCVRPLSAYFASFGGQIWSHVNFLARRRGCIDAPVLRFFAELFYYGRLAETPVVVSCTILRGM